jgi:hypothetical protein
MENFGHSATSSCLDITSSLAATLRALRYPDKERVLWIDQMCIHQGNSKEKSKQMDLMGAIYAGASKVIVWLGEVIEEEDMDCENISKRPPTRADAVEQAFALLAAAQDIWPLKSLTELVDLDTAR